MHDLLIRGGTVIDGTGAPARTADVAIQDDRVAAVGSDLGPAKREIDATGLLVTPGWVDIHTHYDGQVTWDPHLSPSGWNGVTTVVMGNCGVGFAPVHPGREKFLIELMEGVEDIPGTALAEGIQWSWETFPEYLDAIEKMPRSVDVGAQIPHGAVRAYVMGERGAANEEATPEEVDAMAKVVKEGLLAGALGFSTSRTILHRDVHGELVPGTTADKAEVLGIGRMLGEVGHGVFEVASDLAPEGEELEWMKQLSQETGRPVTFACLQNPIDPDQWKRLLAEVDKDTEAGGFLTPQVAQRPNGLLLCFEGTAHPFMFSEAWGPLAMLPPEERRKKLAEPEVREKLLTTQADLSNSGLPGPALLVANGWHMMFPLGDPVDYEPAPEKSVAAIAAREGRDPREVAYDALLANEGRGILYVPLLGYAGGDLEAVREMMQHPRSVYGLSDGGAHCGIICDASMPTFLLTHWVRDRTRGERLPIEDVVHRQTQRTAEFYGMDDRGTIEAGKLADLNVIDLEGLHIHAPEMVYDLPAEGRRLIQRIDGYRYTIKSGQVTYEGGETTGALPGKLVRGPQPAPSAEA
ncbi:MAG: amidohydrolase family protein [Myxococcota bacterium]|nr:amidohydrolase family protein [Myxococcota bacterium]